MPGQSETHTSPCRPPTLSFPYREKAISTDRPAPPACASRALRRGHAKAIPGLPRKFRNIPAKKTSYAPKRVARNGLWRFLRRASATTNPRHAAHAAVPRPMAAAEPASMLLAARTCHRTPPSRTQPIEYGQRCFLCARRHVSRGTDARWASLLASTRRDELARLLHKQCMRAEKRLGKADAARVCIEEIQVRLEELLRARTNCLFQSRRRKDFNRRRIRRVLANRTAQVTAIAHQ